MEWENMHHWPHTRPGLTIVQLLLNKAVKKTHRVVTVRAGGENSIRLYHWVCWRMLIHSGRYAVSPQSLRSLRYSMLGQQHTFKLLNTSRMYHKLGSTKRQHYIHTHMCAHHCRGVSAASSFQSSYLCTDLTPGPTHRQVAFNHSSTGLRSTPDSFSSKLWTPSLNPHGHVPWRTGNCFVKVMGNLSFSFLPSKQRQINLRQTEKCCMHSLSHFWPLPWLNLANVTLSVVDLGHRRDLRQLQI